MSLAALDAEIADLTDKMFNEGMLDDQFSQLQQLQDESNPDFVEEVVSLYFEDSEVKLVKLEELVMQGSPDYTEIDGLVHQFKGSSASIGAAKIATACAEFRTFCQNKDIDSCKRTLKEVTANWNAFKEHLEKILELEKKKNSDEPMEEGGEDEGAGADAGGGSGAALEAPPSMAHAAEEVPAAVSPAAAVAEEAPAPAFTLDIPPPVPAVVPPAAAAAEEAPAFTLDIPPPLPSSTNQE